MERDHPRAPRPGGSWAGGQSVLGSCRNSWGLSLTPPVLRPQSRVVWGSGPQRGPAGEGAAGAGLGTRRWRAGGPAWRVGPTPRGAGRWGAVAQIEPCGQDVPLGPGPGWAGCHTEATTRVAWGQLLEVGERRGWRGCWRDGVLRPGPRPHPVRTLSCSWGLAHVQAQATPWGQRGLLRRAGWAGGPLRKHIANIAKLTGSPASTEGKFPICTHGVPTQAICPRT